MEYPECYFIVDVETSPLENTDGTIRTQFTGTNLSFCLSVSWYLDILPVTDSHTIAIYNINIHGVLEKRSNSIKENSLN